MSKFYSAFSFALNHLHWKFQSHLKYIIILIFESEEKSGHDFFHRGNALFQKPAEFEETK